jgi:hypothetical protein
MDRLSKVRIPLLAALLLVGAVLTASPASAAAPVLTVPGAQSAAEGSPLTFQVSATDADGQTVVLMAGGMPSGATFVDHHNNTGTFDWTPDFGTAGSYTVNFLADDTFGGTDVKSVAIEVTVTNAPPVMSPIGNRNVDQGTTQFVSLSGWDPENDPITFNALGLPPYASFTDYGGGSANITLAPTASTPPGSTDITVTLTDGTNTVSETFTVTVNGTAPVNSPPVLATIGNQAVNEGQVSHVPLSATDPDGDAMSWSVSLPGFAAFTLGNSGPGSITATLDLAPGYCQSGTYSASVAVSDGARQDSETFTITVVNVNRAPTWDAASYSATLSEGGTTSVNVSASDPDEACGQAPPALSLKASDAGGALNASLTDNGNGTGTLALAAASNAAGTWHVTLRQADVANASLASDVTVTVTVNQSETPPAAVAFTDAKQIRLDIGKPRERFYLEPVSGFTIFEVNLSSVRLFAWPGSGTVTSIAPLQDGFDFTTDKDHNGRLELRMEFGKDDLRALFANMGDRVDAAMTLKFTIAGGTQLEVTLNADVAREPKGVIKRLGPNPLNPETAVSVVTARDGRLRVRVFDVNGKLVRTLVDETSVPAGLHVVRFDGRDRHGLSLSSGRYFVQAETDEGDDVSPLTILK